MPDLSDALPAFRPTSACSSSTSSEASLPLPSSAVTAKVDASIPIPAGLGRSASSPGRRIPRWSATTVPLLPRSMLFRLTKPERG